MWLISNQHLGFISHWNIPQWSAQMPSLTWAQPSHPAQGWQASLAFLPGSHVKDKLENFPPLSSSCLERDGENTYSQTDEKVAFNHCCHGDEDQYLPFLSSYTWRAEEMPHTLPFLFSPREESLTDLYIKTQRYKIWASNVCMPGDGESWQK